MPRWSGLIGVVSWLKVLLMAPDEKSDAYPRPESAPDQNSAENNSLAKIEPPSWLTQTDLAAVALIKTSFMHYSDASIILVLEPLSTAGLFGMGGCSSPGPRTANRALKPIRVAGSSGRLFRPFLGHRVAFARRVHRAAGVDFPRKAL